ncbi:hypothetical protein [Nostoc piscinale]|nr:hypothetical protein [Nostoc piscinale]
MKVSKSAMMSECDRSNSSDNDNVLKVSKSAMMSAIAPSQTIINIHVK